MPGHSLKYAATLQQAQEGPAPILIRIETRAGHGAGKPTTKQIDEWVDRFVFLKSALKNGYVDMLDRPFRPQTRVVRRNGAPALREHFADICVVGAGISGVSAAIEAARLGRRVILIDGLPALGGQAVNSIIGMIVGLFGNPPKNKQLTHGIADNIIRDLSATGDLHVVMGGVSLNALYNEVALGRWVERKVLELNITPLVGAILRKVRREGRRITALELSTRYGDVMVRADGFVDATGDAAVVWEAGLECREPAEGVIYGSQMIVIENFDEANKPSRAEMSERIRERGAQYGMIRRDGFAMSFPGRATAVVNMTHIENPMDPFGASKTGSRARNRPIDDDVSALGVSGGFASARAFLRAARHPADALDCGPASTDRG